MSRFLWIILLLGLIGISSTPARADLVVNGGFETGNFSGWSTTAAGTGSDFGVSTAYAHGGSIYGAFFGGSTVGSYDTISQSLATSPGELYRLSFWVENLGGAPNGFEASWDSTRIVNIVDSAAFGWTQFTFTLSAATSNTLLELGAYQKVSFFGLDDVSVTAASSVPEPTTLTLMAIGLVGMGALGCRRILASPKAAGDPPANAVRPGG